MSHLVEHEQAVAEALAPLGLRVTSDPAAAVAPCLLIDHLPTYVRPSACGLVWRWEAILLPAATTDHLAALWLADNLVDVNDRIPGQVEAIDPVMFSFGDDRAAAIPAYKLTYQA